MLELYTQPHADGAAEGSLYQYPQNLRTARAKHETPRSTHVFDATAGSSPRHERATTPHDPAHRMCAAPLQQQTHDDSTYGDCIGYRSSDTPNTNDDWREHRNYRHTTERTRKRSRRRNPTRPSARSTKRTCTCTANAKNQHDVVEGAKLKAQHQHPHADETTTTQPKCANTRTTTPRSQEPCARNNLGSTAKRTRTRRTPGETHRHDRQRGKGGVGGRCPSRTRSGSGPW